MSYWVAGVTKLSAALLNQKTVTIDVGTNLAALSPTYADQIVISTDTSGGFTQDTIYQRNAANTSWISVLTMQKHLHNADTAAAGGLLSDIYAANMGISLYQTELLSPAAGDFFTTVSGTGAAVTDGRGSGVWRVDINSGTTLNAAAQADLGGLRADFGSKMKFQAKVEQQTATTSLQCRIGVNNELASAAADPTTKSLGFEFCDSTGTTYQLESCDGATRTVTNTTFAFNGVHGIKFAYTPSTNVVGTIDNNTATTKTTNLPNSGQTLPDRLMRFGIMSTVAAAAKHLYIYGAALNYIPNEGTAWTA